MSQRRAVVSVIGKDQIGILDISQTILQDFFTMMMIVDVTNHQDLEALQNQLSKIGKPIGLTITLQLEEIFQAMHRV